MLLAHWIARARSHADPSSGNSIATRMVMMAMATSSSTSVKPAVRRRCVAMAASPDVLRNKGRTPTIVPCPGGGTQDSDTVNVGTTAPRRGRAEGGTTAAPPRICVRTCKAATRAEGAMNNNRSAEADPSGPYAAAWEAVESVHFGAVRMEETRCCLPAFHPPHRPAGSRRGRAGARVPLGPRHAARREAGASWRRGDPGRAVGAAFDFLLPAAREA